MSRVLDGPAWAIDDTGLLKYGKASPSVARQYTGTAYPLTVERTTVPYGGDGLYPKKIYRQAAVSARQLLLATGPGAVRRVTWRDSSRQRRPADRDELELRVPADPPGRPSDPLSAPRRGPARGVAYRRMADG
jgi:DDE superfamily endonuclease